MLWSSGAVPYLPDGRRVYAPCARGPSPGWHIAIVMMRMSFWAQNKDYFVNGSVSVLVLVGTWAIYRGMKHAVDRFSRRRNLAEVDPGAETRLRMIVRLAAVSLLFVAVGVVFWIMDVSALKRVAVGMFASAGVAGIGIGFAAQATLANLVSGVIIAFVQPIRLGDSVLVETEFGTVESIGLFYTNIRTWDNRRLVIPNKLLSDRAIRNYTLVDPQTPATVVLRLDYGADVALVRSVLLEEARAHPAFLSPPEPSVQVIDADITGFSVRLIAWAASQMQASELAADVRERALIRLTESGTMKPRSVDCAWTTTTSCPPGASAG
jgi:small-conductance mechanosensitive channel